MGKVSGHQDRNQRGALFGLFVGFFFVGVCLGFFVFFWKWQSLAMDEKQRNEVEQHVSSQYQLAVFPFLSYWQVVCHDQM